MPHVHRFDIGQRSKCSETFSPHFSHSYFHHCLCSRLNTTPVDSMLGATKELCGEQFIISIKVWTDRLGSEVSVAVNTTWSLRSRNELFNISVSEFEQCHLIVHFTLIVPKHGRTFLCWHRRPVFGTCVTLAWILFCINNNILLYLGLFPLQIVLHNIHK